MSTTQLLVGVASFLAFLCTVRIREGIWLAPTTVFLAFYFSATILAPSERIYLNILHDYDLDCFPTATNYSIGGMWAMWAGYMLVRQRKPRLRSTIPLRPMLSAAGLEFVHLMLIGVVVLQWVVLLLGGGLSQAKGANSYFANVNSWFLVGQYTILIYPLFLAVVVDAFARYSQGIRVGKAFLCVVAALVLLASIATFSRQIFVWAGLYVFLVYHSRRGFTSRQFTPAVVLVLIVSLFARLREDGVGLAELGGERLNQTFADSFANWGETLYSVGGSVSGQEVFTNVLGRVPECENYKYGRTYLASFLGLVTPRFLTQNFAADFIDTPAFWYKRWYAPDMVGVGLDFSMLAEAYMNFGPWMLLLLLGLGAFVGYASSVIRCSGSAMSVYVCVVCITAMCFGVRNDSNALFKTVAYFNLFVWLLVRLTSSKRASRDGMGGGVRGVWSGAVGSATR